MSLPPLEFVYLTEDSIKELRNSNSNFRFPSPAPVLRFLYELCFTMVRGDLPYQKCKGALEAVEFLDCGPEGDVGSYFADIVAQMAQDMKLNGNVLKPAKNGEVVEHCAEDSAAGFFCEKDIVS
ncbi:UNVERIFIED_CONTAM: THO complex subunit [Sesamum radiatum]|uniref:THO complex subunit n=1 Tax=Sesamum radiatum TaxID=300843 RepID=A0AAW2U0C7_SESRA